MGLKQSLKQSLASRQADISGQHDCSAFGIDHATPDNLTHDHPFTLVKCTHMAFIHAYGQVNCWNPEPCSNLAHQREGAVSGLNYIL